MNYTDPLQLWFLTFFEVLDPTSSIHAFIESFVVRSSDSKHMHITIYCISARTGGVNQTAEPLKLTDRIQIKNHYIRA